MKVSLALKLMFINVFVISFGMLVVWLAIDILASEYTTQLMAEFNILPARIHWLFLSAVHRYLMWGALAAVGVATVLSLLMTRQVLRPLREMRAVAEKIAAGDYSRRAAVATHDEIAELARDLNRMTDSLERIEALRKEMVTDVAHELRTPLTNMRGYVEGLRDGVVQPDQENFDVLHEQCLRLAKLVDNLMQLAEVDAASLTFSPSTVDLNAMVEDTKTLVQTRLDEKHLRLEVTIADDARRFEADRDKLTQVLLNLMENAARYAVPDSRIAIVAGKNEGNIDIVFSNDISPDTTTDFSMVFERFYRGERSRSREYGGAGIGLAIVKELVELHGGEVKAVLAENRVTIRCSLPVTQLVLHA